MTKPRELTYHFARWAKELAPSDIPDAVQSIGRRAMIDTLGVMIAGGAHADIKRLAAIWPAPDGVCGLATGGTAAAEHAALINGSSAHFWDFDDASYTGIMHGSAVVFPVVAALAQELDASEEEALAAFIVGSEIAYVLGDICTHRHYFHGWWSTATLGLVGATAAAARLFGGSEETIAQAIGLAAAAAGGGKSVFGTDAKPFLCGEAAQRAVAFARFTNAGLTGPTISFHTDTGFLHLLNSDIEQAGVAETLGLRWRLTDPGLLVKRYPVCSAAHAAIEEIARLTYGADIAADQVAAIHIEVPKLGRISLVHDNPKTRAEAQFCMPFAAACAVMHGAVRLEDLSAKSLQSENLRALMKRVQIAEAEDLSTEEMRNKYPESARVRIVLTGNSERSGFCGAAYGMPSRPLSDEDFLAKFQECLTFAGRPTQSRTCMNINVLDLTADLFGPKTGDLENAQLQKGEKKLDFMKSKKTRNRENISAAISYEN